MKSNCQRCYSWTMLLAALVLLVSGGVSIAAQVQRQAQDQPQGLRVKPGKQGKVYLSWSLPASFSEVGIVDAQRNKSLETSTALQLDPELEVARDPQAETAYPLALSNSPGAKTLLGYRVLRNGTAISSVLNRRYFVTDGDGDFSVEAVYADGQNSATSPTQIGIQTPTTEWLDCNIEQVNVSAYPRVSVRVSVEEGDLPLSAFRLEEEGAEMTLLDECFASTSDQLVDVCLVIDRSSYMNDYICAVASALDCIADDIPACVDLKFSLVFYGKDNNGSSACGAQYAGSPKHENQSSLRTIESAAARLWEVGGYTLTGNQEPAYHAIQCGLNVTPWRTGSRRLMILVSDANNDHCTWNGAIPQLSVNDLNTLLDTREVTFYAWCNYSIGCDCYDDCDSDRIPCDQWQSWGCNSGYTDFRPLADHTGGTTRNICYDFWDLLDEIEFDGRCEYTICYDARCCNPGSRRDIELDIEGSWHSCTEWCNYTINNCPNGSGHDPWINCAANNPTGFNPGEPVTVCVEAGDQDNDISRVIGHFSFGGCNQTLDAVHGSGNLWCVTIPGSCTNASGDLTVNFTVEDLCERVASVSCTIPNNVCLPPDIACWSGNPETYQPGNAVTVCAVVRCANDDHSGDNDGHDGDDDDDNCNHDRGSWGGWRKTNGDWHDGDCDGDHDDDHCDEDDDDGGEWRDGDGHWHDRHCDGHHGWWDDNDCDGDHNDDGDWQCHDGRWHDEDCDGDHDEDDGEDCPEIETVIATYTLGGCNFSGEATRIEGNRYCISVPASCLANCQDLVVRFTATNECGETDEVSCTVTCDTCVIHVGDYRTQTQGGWGQDNCSGGNVACIRNANFATCFPGGITLGSTYTARFTSSAAIATYLPRGTIPGVLTNNVTNPTWTTSAGVFLSQVLALGLNLGFADCGVPGFNHDLGPLEIAGGPFAGMTVDELFALANQVLGGAGGLPPGTTLQQLNDAVDAINNNFDNGTQDCQYLRRVCEPQNCIAPDAQNWSGNLRHFLRGSDVVVCATVSSDEPYTVSGHYNTFACNQAAAPTQAETDRWCMTIPANCTWDNHPVSATFVFTNRCGVDSITIEIPPCIGLVVHADPNNPTYYTPGQPITICANVTDEDGDFGPETFMGHWWFGTPGNCENNAFGTCDDNGHCCITIPAHDCMNGCQDLYIDIMADDTCGAWDRDTVVVRANNRPPVVTCWSGNPTQFVYGQPLTVCASVADPDNNIASVLASYNTGDNCNRTVAASFADGRWCVTIPDSCMRTCSNVSVTFVATDNCGNSDTETCTVNARTGRPTVSCWNEGNPTTFVYGQPLTVCVITGGDNPVASVTASYNTGSNCNTTVPAVLNEGRWCVTIPGTCTQTCSNIAVSFTATDVCGRTRTRTCTVNARTANPTATCWDGNPTTFNFGAPLTMCVIAEGVNPIQTVTASYNTGANCNRTVNAINVEGNRWCVTLSDTCTRTCSNIAVNFTITDVCGRTATRSCTANSVNTPPVQACWEGNPAIYQYGQPVNVCVMVNDAQNNVSGVTGQYMVGTCNTTVNATRIEGNRWCITVPGSCTQSCDPLRVRFVATDACGATDVDTCRVNSSGTAPQANCFTGFPTTYYWGQPIQACITVNDPDNDVVSATASYNTGPNCNTTVSATFAEGRWCITIPGTCTQVCGPIIVNWLVTDACGRTGTTPCTYTNIPRGPVVDCWEGNPQQYQYGQSLTMCAVVNDPDNNVVSVSTRFIGTNCNIVVPATFANGRWCATIGAGCTNSCEPIIAIFTATDACGSVEDDTCRVTTQCRPPVVLCDEQGPRNYFYGEPFQACALVGDPDGDLASVTATYNGANCNETVPAVPSGPGRYCVTIPANCTMVYGSIYVIFTATDNTGRTDRDTCYYYNIPRPPTVRCWENNPSEYLYGTTVEMCAIVADPDHDIVSVNAHVSGGSCDQIFPAINMGGGRWCITIPATCTQSFTPIMVVFTATDGAGQSAEYTCPLNAGSIPCPPVDVQCWTDNIRHYLRGSQVYIFATVTSTNPYTVNGRFHTNSCAQSQTPVQVAPNRWCITVPANCTWDNYPINATFVVQNDCGNRDSITCEIPPCIGLVVTADPNNPAFYTPGQPVTVCATVTDADGDFGPETFLGHWWVGTPGNCENNAFGTCDDNGHCCLTIPPADCINGCQDLYIEIMADDTCGAWDRDTVIVRANNRPPVATCWSNNPQTFIYGQALAVYANVSDPDNNLVGVTASYQAGNCSATVPATPIEGRWCVIIPDSCTRTCSNLSVTFTGTDACGRTGSTTCPINARDGLPTVTCWNGNPVNFAFGQALQVCAIVEGPNPIQSVTGSYNTGPNCNRTVNAVRVEGNRWCITIPDSCTRTCSNITVNFTATDVCGRIGAHPCTINSVNTPPAQACWDGNPATYQYGQPVNVCVMVNDAQNNVTGVTGQYMVGNCNTTVNATRIEGNRWCITVPGSCTQACNQLRVRFVATDACGATDVDTCRVNSAGTAPQANCFTGFPTTYLWGQPINACITVVDPDNDVTSVTASYNTGPNCNSTVNATFADGRWCIIIPGTCTMVCGPIAVNWTVTDACGRTGTIACTYTNIPRGPVVDCWEGNPQQYQHGQPLTMCAVVGDLDNNVTGVSARFLGASCDVTVPAAFANGRWCATIGSQCTNSCSEIFVIFTATDACGLVEDDTCRVSANCRPPVVYCDEQNPHNYFYGDPINACALVGDPDGDLVSVTATYNGSTCNETVPATPAGDGRYCVTIPGSCTMVYGSIYVIFNATDQTGRTDRDTCYFYNTPRPPTIQCWVNNPDEYLYDTEVQVCAIASDPDNDIASVVAHVYGGSCDQNFNANYLGGGLYCITIPASCTQSYTLINVDFAVTDGGGRTAQHSCPLNAGSTPCTPPYIVCDEENPGYFNWGQPVTMCSRITDADNDITQVTARYIAGACDVTIPAAHVSGDLYCATVPGNCTETLGDVIVIFTAYDQCRPTQPVSMACTSRVYCAPPTIECWEGNPNEYVFGATLTACASVYDPNGDITGVTAHFIGDQCDETVATELDDNGNYCVTIPGACTESAAPITVIFRATDRCGLWAEATCVFNPPPTVDECCYMCTLDIPALYQSEAIDIGRAGSATTIKVENGRLRLFWQRVPEAEFYQIYCLNSMDDAPLTSVGFIPNNSTTSWMHPTPVRDLPLSCYFQVLPMRSSALQIPECGDRGRWEFNDCEGDVVPDASGQGWDATGWFECSPSCSTETDEQCADQSTGFAHFDGYVFTPDRCEVHYRVTNDTLWYEDDFQVWTRLRLDEEPTINTGPFYIVANASFDVLGGGWALRIDPAWYMQNGVRQYHNRLTALVWNQSLNGGNGGWMTLQSPAPTPADPDRWSVPVGEWSCVCMVVDGNQSMLIINGVVVAAGDLRLNSHNNLAPLVIGAGYRHNTHPIEYPFRGDLDCLRISDICNDNP